MSKTKKILVRLRQLREAKGFRQGYMATRLGIDRTTYVRKELGLIPITTEEWVKLAKFMNEEPCRFFLSSAAPAGHPELETKEKNLIDLYRSLRLEEKRDLLAVITIMLKGNKRKKVTSALEKLRGGKGKDGP
ncbi:MAG: helix-turn-helix domain-containing protein [Thermodesulfobacteriota bacterium]